MRERLQAITEKHHIQEVIRQKKMELDQEKLRLKHLKKKSLREQWLLQGSHNAPGSTSSEQQIRALMLNVYRIEKEIESWEREESIVSKNEGFILNRLRAVEKSTEDIIKEAQESFVPEPLPVGMVTPVFPESFNPSTIKLPEPDLNALPRKTLFAMEINVNKNLHTGESTVLSAASVSPEELHQHSGLKVYDDGRKCVYALHSQEGSDDQSTISELSANEVEQLLKSDTVHRQMNHQNSRKNGHRFYSHNNSQRQIEEHTLRNLVNEDEEICRRRSFENHCNGHCQIKRNVREIQRGTSFKTLQQNNNNYCPNQVRRHKSFQNRLYNTYHNNSTDRANRYPPRSHDQVAISRHQLSYTPASDIPLNNYISVDEEEEMFRYRPSTQLASPAPSPIYGEDMPYTVLNDMETTEPITAIFMGFQTAQDDSCRGQEFEGALKAELVIIDDDYGKEKSETKQKTPANGTMGRGKERQMEKRVGPGQDVE